MKPLLRFALGCVVVFLTLGFTLTGGWAATGAARVTLSQAVDLLQQAEKLVNDDARQALAKLKEARQLFKQLQQELAEPLSRTYLTPAQLEQEAANNRIAEDLFQTGKRLEASAQEKQSKALRLEAQGDRSAAANLRTEADQELQLALQNYCRAELYSLKNQQLVFETILRAARQQ